MCTCLLEIVKDLEFAKTFDPSDYDIPLEIRSKYHLVMLDHHDGDHTKSRQQLEQYFADYIVERELEENDLTATFAKMGLDINDFEYDEWTFEEMISPECEFYKFRNKQTGEVIRIPFNECVNVIHKCKYVLFQYVHEFKGLYKQKSFMKWSKLDDFDEKGNRDPYAMTYIIDNFILDRAREHFFPNAPIHEWEFTDEDHVVFFSW